MYINELHTKINIYNIKVNIHIYIINITIFFNNCSIKKTVVIYDIKKLNPIFNTRIAMNCTIL